MWWWWYWPLGCWRWISIVGSSPGHGNNGTRFFCVRVFFSLFYLFISKENVLLLLLLLLLPADGINCATLLVVIHALLFFFLLWLLKNNKTKQKTKVEKWIIIIWFFGGFSNVQIVLAVINDMIFLVLFFFSLSHFYVHTRSKRVYR